MLTQEQVDGLKIGDTIYHVTNNGITPGEYTGGGNSTVGEELRTGYYYLTKAEARQGRMQFLLDRMDGFAAAMQKTTLEIREFIKQMEEAGRG